MDLEGIMLSEVSQIYCRAAVTHGILEKKELKATENRLLVLKSGD